jgi:anaerobic selenocysteine-containing dehydrogenase
MWVHKRGGLVTAVRGNPAHPISRGALCGKCSTAYNREWRDPERRLTQPLRRAGAKGGGRFEPITWETAFGEIAQRLHQVIASHGAQTILNAHYTGTISLLAGIAPGESTAVHSVEVSVAAFPAEHQYARVGVGHSH